MVRLKQRGDESDGEMHLLSAILLTFMGSSVCDCTGRQSIQMAPKPTLSSIERIQHHSDKHRMEVLGMERVASYNHLFHAERVLAFSHQTIEISPLTNEKNMYNLYGGILLYTKMRMSWSRSSKMFK